VTDGAREDRLLVALKSWQPGGKHRITVTDPLTVRGTYTYTAIFAVVTVVGRPGK
jgi:hypothetical protein